MSAVGHGDVVVCEPQWKGLVHAPFNAAFLETIRVALPGRRVVFLADESHLREVDGVLKAFSRQAADIEFVENAVGNRDAWSRSDQLRAVRGLVVAARSRNAALAVLLSFSGLQLSYAKAMRGLGRLRCGLVAVLHSNVSHLTGREQEWGLRGVIDRSRSRWNRAAWPSRVAVCVLGRTISAEVVRRLPARAVRVGSVHHPYLFADPPSSDLLGRRTRDLRVVLIGSTSKGKLGEFLRVARRIREAEQRVRFVLAGGLKTDSEAIRNEALALFEGPVHSRMLTTDEYHERLRTATFGVVHLDPRMYETRVSAGTLDALSAGLPSFLTSVPANDACVEEDGIPAWTYRNAQELEAGLTRVLREFTSESYRSQVEAVIRSRSVYSPESVAREFQEMLVKQLGWPDDTSGKEVGVVRDSGRGR